MNKRIACRDCMKVFVMTDEEQSWYVERGWDFPKRCLSCRRHRRIVGDRQGMSETGRSRERGR